MAGEKQTSIKDKLQLNHLDQTYLYIIVRSVLGFFLYTLKGH